MEYLFISIGVLILIGIGLFSLLLDRERNIKRKNFALEYNNKLAEYCNSHFRNNELFTWLQKNAPKLQGEMGGWGIMEHVKLPFQNYLINNYQVIFNELEEINQNNHIGFPDESFQNADMIRNCILRYVGDLENKFDTYKSKLRNPFILFNIGFNKVFYLPILIISYLFSGGLKVYNISQRGFIGAIFKFIKFILEIVTVISSIITIALGWSGFIELVKKTFRIS